MYNEPEITQPTDLCEADGSLNVGAIGWSRRPLQRCNLTGAFPRKKRWHYWSITGPERMVSVTVASVDYLFMVGLYVIDYAKGCLLKDGFVLPGPGPVDFPETVYGRVEFRSGGKRVLMDHREEGALIEVDWRAPLRRKFRARIEIESPPNHETLNVVVPWDKRRFQFTSKQNALPASGGFEIGRNKYVLNAADTFACLDYGRGIWPYDTRWNWSSFSARSGQDVVGVNFGAKWTAGTGTTENALTVNGRLDKLSEEVVFGYDRDDFMRPWTLETAETERVRLTFSPFYNFKNGLQLGVLSARVNQLFGRFNGTLIHEGRLVEVTDAVGWAEEHIARW